MLRSSLHIIRRAFSSSVEERERLLTDLLRKGIQGVTAAQVEDASGGCGAMYNVYVEAEAFKGKSIVAQHKIVTSVLKEQIKDMHGLTIKTKTPK